MIRRQLVLMAFGALLAGGIIVATPADAMTLDQVVATIRDARGHYAPRSASLTASDCSGLVSVAQTLAMGQDPHRLGDTHSLLAGRWPGAIPGADPSDLFIVATSSTHMVAQINGVGIEARQSGEGYRLGPDAASPWDRQFTRQFHIDPGVLIA